MSTASAGVVSSVDRALMVDFARRWLQYGGGSAADIFVQFGVTEEVFFRRLTDVITQREDVPLQVRAEISALCVARLETKKASAKRSPSGARTKRH